MGYSMAGFEVVGVDIDKQPNYPFKFIQGDVLDMELPPADIYHASPPCQPFSQASKRYRNAGKQYEDVLTPLREKLLKTGNPFIIENVPGAPMRIDLMLCGEMFGRELHRHRWFEIHGFTILQPPHEKHKLSVKEGTAAAVYGSNGSLFLVGKPNYKELYEQFKKNRAADPQIHLTKGKKAMGIDWMNWTELTQAIPPVYTEFIGRWAMSQLF